MAKMHNLKCGTRVIVKKSVDGIFQFHAGKHGIVEHVDPRSSLYPLSVRLDGSRIGLPFDAEELKLESK